MQRTGCISLFHSLYKHGEFALVTHCLDVDKINTVNLSGTAKWACKYIIIPRKRAKIISLVRNPIDNMLSVFARDYLTAKSETHNADKNDLSQQFVVEYLQSDCYLYQLEWFNLEFKSVLGINIYDYPFDKQQGHAQFQQGLYDVLIVQTEINDDKKASLVSKFLGLSNFTMLPRSSILYTISGLPPGMPGEKASYSDQYKLLKRHISIPEKYLDIILNSEFSQHFFSKDLLNKTRLRFTI